MSEEVVVLRNRSSSRNSSSSSSRRNSDETRIITPPIYNQQIANRMSPINQNYSNNPRNSTSFIILILKILTSILLLVMLLTFSISFMISIFSGAIQQWKAKHAAYKNYSKIITKYECNNKQKIKIPIDTQICNDAREKYYEFLANQPTILQLATKSLAQSLNSFTDHIKTQGFVVILIFISVLIIFPNPKQ